MNSNALDRLPASHRESDGGNRAISEGAIACLTLRTDAVRWLSTRCEHPHAKTESQGRLLSSIVFGDWQLFLLSSSFSCR